MRVAVVKESKPAERRVGLLPPTVRMLASAGHEVMVETGAGLGAGAADEAFVAAGARLVEVDEAWGEADLLVKVKEPVAEEYRHFREGLTIFAFLHLAADRALTEHLVRSGMSAIAYETVTDAEGRLELLAPMSEIAGRLATQVAAHHLLAPFGGPGLLVGGAPGVQAARVVVIGGGVVGTQAALIAVGMEAEVTILDKSVQRVRTLSAQFGARARVLVSDEDVLDRELADADVVIGAVLVPGASAPKVVTRGMLERMSPNSVLVDVAIDQGGCFETSRVTTHQRPTFTAAGRLHYCVGNMPGAVPLTSTRALTNATAPYVMCLAEHGAPRALARYEGLASGLNVAAGSIRHQGVARAFPDLPSA